MKLYKRYKQDILYRSFLVRIISYKIIDSYNFFFDLAVIVILQFLVDPRIRKWNDLLWRCRRYYYQHNLTTRWGLALKWIVKSFLPPLDSVHEHMYRMLRKQIAGVRPLFSRKLSPSFPVGPLFIFAPSLFHSPASLFVTLTLSFRSIVSPSSLVRRRGNRIVALCLSSCRI